jgi:hypothetical protein
MQFFPPGLTSAIPDTLALSAPVAVQAPTMLGHLSDPCAATPPADQPNIGPPQNSTQAFFSGVLGMMCKSFVAIHSPRFLTAAFQANNSSILFTRQPGDYYQTSPISTSNVYIIIREGAKSFPAEKRMPLLREHCISLS